MKKTWQPKADVILTCTNIQKKSGATYSKEGYRIVYMDEASFNRDFYITDLIKMVSGEPIFTDRTELAATIKCLNACRVAGR
jgi:hypothetical protein